jgi:hypothetical protein
MIVRPDIDDLLLVTQPDHAALAGAIMDAWRADGLLDHPWRDTLLLPTREHDGGWSEPDAAPLVDPASGAPYDFLEAPVPVRQAVWPRGVARLVEAHPYAAALVARHALTVLRRERDRAEWRSFFETMERAETDALAHATGAERAGWPADYRFLFLGDLVSLVFCNGWTQPFEAEGYRIILTQAGIRVTPDPFGGRAVPLAVRARRIPARRYGSDADLRDALAATPAVMLRGVAQG